MLWLCFCYADDVVLFANTLGDAQKLMKALEKNCMHTKLSVNRSKTRIMLVKSQKRDKPCIMYNIEPLECVESFKYLGLEVPSNLGMDAFIFIEMCMDQIKFINPKIIEASNQIDLCGNHLLFICVRQQLPWAESSFANEQSPPFMENICHDCSSRVLSCRGSCMSSIMFSSIHKGIPSWRRPTWQTLMSVAPSNTSHSTNWSFVNFSSIGSRCYQSFFWAYDSH